jgi:hypothetical protein
VYRDKGLEFRYIQIVIGFMRESGERTKEMDRATKSTRMELTIRASLKETNLMEKEFIIGRMGRSMMVNGFSHKSKALEFGRETIKTLMLESGRTIKQTAMGFTYGPTEINMKENG